jgi:excisionase family DNA binding protein
MQSLWFFRQFASEFLRRLRTQIRKAFGRRGEIMAPKNLEDYPVILDSKNIAELLGVSRTYAYEIMEHKSFPLIRIGSQKRVQRDAFFKWLDEQAERHMKQEVV